MDRKLKGCLRVWWGMLLSFWFMSLLPVTLKRVHTLPSVIFCSYCFLEQSYSHSFCSPGHLFFSFFHFFESEWIVTTYSGWNNPTQTSTDVVKGSLFQCFSSVCEKKISVWLDQVLKTDVLLLNRSANTEWIHRWKMCMSCVCVEPAWKALT